MTQKSHGSKRGTRQKFHSKGKPTITRFLQEFNVGDSVHVDIRSNVRGHPHHRFQGLTGRVVEKRGSGYVVQLKDRTKTKVIVTKPVHLKPVGKTK
jgi:large subunit ribosomal protein L21e